MLPSADMFFFFSLPFWCSERILWLSCCSLEFQVGFAKRYFFFVQAYRKRMTNQNIRIYISHIKSMKKKQTTTHYKITSTIRLDTDLHWPHRPLHQDKRASQGFQPETTLQIQGKVRRKLYNRKGQTHIPTTRFRGRTQQQWKGQARCAEQGFQKPSSHRQGTKQFPSVGVAKLSRYQERRCHQILEIETRVPDVSIIATECEQGTQSQ